MLDVLIRQGKVIDGTGKKPPVKFDIGINDGTIIKIGDLSGETGKKEINAKGKIVAPGFIDINSHSDTKWCLFRYPDQESLILQGVTTIIGGNCGSSLAPIIGEGSIKSLRKWVPLGDVQIDWDKMGEYLDYLEDNRPLRVNYGTLVGHATLRRGILGEKIRPLSKKELLILADQIDRAIEEGALGVSLGLNYTHSRISGEEEITAISNIVSERNVLLSVHLRGESNNLIQSLKQLISAVELTGVNLEISHFKALGSKSWPLFKKALDIIEKARGRGLNINFDIYPYSYSGPVLYTLLPEWITSSGREDLIKNLKNPKLRQKVISDMKRNNLNYSKIIIASSPLSRMLIQKSISEIAKSRKTNPEEVILDLVIASEDQCSVIAKLLSERNVTIGITHPLSIISSGGAGYSEKEAESGNLIHPRSFGAFSRFLSVYARDKKKLSLSKAIQKITSLPAQKVGLRDRGLIKEGFKADITIVDVNKYKDNSSLEEPYHYSEGVETVLVNGEITVSNGKLVAGARYGEILRRRKFAGMRS